LSASVPILRRGCYVRPGGDYRGARGRGRWGKILGPCLALDWPPKCAAPKPRPLPNTITMAERLLSHVANVGPSAKSQAVRRGSVPGQANPPSPSAPRLSLSAAASGKARKATARAMPCPDTTPGHRRAPSPVCEQYSCHLRGTGSPTYSPARPGDPRSPSVLQQHRSHDLPHLVSRSCPDQNERRDALNRNDRAGALEPQAFGPLPER
jgi:hypothetical protein